MNRFSIPELSRRHAALTLALLFSVAQVSAGLHLAVVEHETCEHGDVVHADGSHSSADSAAPLAMASLSPIDFGVDALEVHDHCDVSICENALPEPPSTTLLELEQLALGKITPDDSSTSSWWPTHRQYEVAPKQSPPRAA